MTDKIEEVLEAAIFKDYAISAALVYRQDIPEIAKAVRKACAGAEVSDAITNGAAFLIGHAGMKLDDQAADYHQGGA